MLQEKYPILEFDPCREAVIEPAFGVKKYGTLPSDKLIITFFKDAISLLLEEGRIKQILTVEGENEVPLYQFVDGGALLMHGVIGCPATGGFLDELIGLGIRRVMFCGGGGVLDPTIGVGELLVVEGAIRDEGFSYHYVAPSRIIYAREDIKNTICEYLTEKGIPHRSGLCWTTDAFYRETREKVARRRAEGAKIVEMEQSGCIAVSQFRGIKYGAIIYGGDDVSGDAWDNRAWTERHGIRYNLVTVCRELLERI